MKMKKNQKNQVKNLINMQNNALNVKKIDVKIAILMNILYFLEHK